MQGSCFRTGKESLNLKLLLKWWEPNTIILFNRIEEYHLEVVKIFMRGRGWPRKRQTWKAYASFFKLQELYCVSFILFQHAFLTTPSSVLSFRGNLKTTPIRLYSLWKGSRVLEGEYCWHFNWQLTVAASCGRLLNIIKGSEDALARLSPTGRAEKFFDWNS